MKQSTEEPDAPPVLNTRDFMVTGEEFALLRRSPEGLLQTWPSPADTSPYYQSEAYLSHTDGNNSLFERLYQILKATNLKSKLRLLKELERAPGKLLDFGAGTGDFLNAAKKAGWSVTGVEPNKGARDKARQKGVAVCAGIKELPEASYDCISLWHVLEHLPDPEGVIKELGSRLKSAGHFIVAVPNYKSTDARFYGAHWAAYDTPRHLWHFSRTALKALFDDWGYELHLERAQWLDAYYVSWLSEKYRKNPLAPFRAFLIATYSNLAALCTGESSSRIYIFKRKG